MHEHVARALYYFSVHLFSASAVGIAAWLLTAIRGTSATTKYWIWVATAFNFVVPLGALIDKLWAPHLSWAAPLDAIGGPVWDMTQGWTAIALAALWTAGALAMFVRLIARLARERQAESAIAPPARGATSTFMADGIPVSFDNARPTPAVTGILSPHILLPVGIDRLLDQREFHAVLLHEVAHARRCDNLIRLLYEISLCALWFHPLMWLAGARMALYRELSCDESVIRRAHGEALVSALAKLAVPQPDLFLHATAASHLGHRLVRLAEPPHATHRARNLLLASLFAMVVAAGILQTVSHTACCFILNR